MSENSSEQTENNKQNVLSSFKKLFKNREAPTNELELHQCTSNASTSLIQPQQAVFVRNAYKSYGTPCHPLVVLDGFNMTVSKGTIYALLGASGCGKTTLLSCLLNQRTLNSGQIWILGGEPGSRTSGVPGPRVGFMPQATAIYGDFTIDETFLYYGWVLGLSNQKIHERCEFLKKLLMLPKTDQLVKYLSGGQQRRVSLASALLHEPELLILDEPTVGVDPLLRETIWEHLVNITREGNTTIILTTHYIEEARQAHIVGLMREGCLLAEEPPEKLMLRYKAQTLEDVFLKLSVKQNQRFISIKETKSDVAMPVIGWNVGQNPASSQVTDSNLKEDEKVIQGFISIKETKSDVAMPVIGWHVGQNPASNQVTDSYLKEDEKVISLPEIPPWRFYRPTFSDYKPSIKLNHLKALVWKGFLWMMRNISAMLCVILLPVTQIVVFCYAIGRDATNLPIAVVNYETNNSVSCNNTLACYSMELSCGYLGYLENRSMILRYYDSEDVARESVLKGQNFASIMVRHNYSKALRARIEDAESADIWDIVSSQMDVFRDLSNKHIATQLKAQLYDTFQIFIQDYVETCGIERKYLKVPINWETPIYGEKYPNFTEFALPGILMILTFFLAVATTAFGLLIERNEGSFERTFVMGITEIELLIAHITCQFVIMASQTFMSLVCSFVVFDMTLKGSIFLLSLHTLLTGFCGMCYGILVSCVCDREETATFFAIGSVLPLLFLSGTIWPVEAIHPLLRPMAHFLPLTQGTESLRSLLQKGWGITSQTIYLGFISLSLWTVVFLIVSILFLKFKKSEFMYNVLPLLVNEVLRFWHNIK